MQSNTCQLSLRGRCAHSSFMCPMCSRGERDDEVLTLLHAQPRGARKRPVHAWVRPRALLASDGYNIHAVPRRIGVLPTANRRLSVRSASVFNLLRTGRRAGCTRAAQRNAQKITPLKGTNLSKLYAILFHT
eukprot:6861665-Prymnesium_polylepis.1